MNQSGLEANKCNRCQARENACDQDMIGFGFVSHWLRKWHEFCETITGRSDAKTNYFRQSIDSHSNRMRFGINVTSCPGTSIFF